MSRTIRPRPCDWPALFWRRATSSYADNDLACPACLGSGCEASRGSACEGMTVEDAACTSCRSSGLLVPARHLPDDIEAVWAADEEGGGWLEWMEHKGDGLLWPAAWCWVISRRRFANRHDVYFYDGNVLAFMRNGSVIAGLFRLDEDGPRHLNGLPQGVRGGRPASVRAALTGQPKESRPGKITATASGPPDRKLRSRSCRVTS